MPQPTTPTQTAKPQNLSFPDEAFRATQPKAGEPRPFQLPSVKQFSLANGIKVFLIEQHTLPLVSMDLSFDGGSVTDPKGKEGLASVCMALMGEGTQSLDKIAFSEALADVASDVRSYASDDQQGLSMNTLTEHLDATLGLFFDVLRAPGMRADDFDRLIKRSIEGVKQQKGSPASISNRVQAPVLFGKKSPYGAVITPESLKAITLDDCKSYASHWLKPHGAKLFVVGDLTEAQLRTAFGKDSAAGKKIVGWTGNVPSLPKVAAGKPMDGRIFLVDVPGAAQSNVSVLAFGPKRTAKDYFSNTLASSVLGGGFTSRINMNLREDKGYAYGARGSFGYSRDYGTFTATASVRTDSTFQSLLEMTKEIEAMASGKSPPTAEELEREKAGVVLGLPGRFATAAQSLGQYRSLSYFGLPLDYFNHYVEHMTKVDAAQVKGSLAHLPKLKSGDAVLLVVGDANAAMIEHKLGPDGKAFVDAPLLDKDGKAVTLRAALEKAAASGDYGHGGLVVLDADGVQISAAATKTAATK